MIDKLRNMTKIITRRINTIGIFKTIATFDNAHDIAL